MSKITDISIRQSCINAKGSEQAYQDAIDYLKKTYDNFPKDKNLIFRIELHIENS